MRSRHLVAFLLTAASVAAQQLVLAQNDDLSYGNNAVGWPASVLAFRFTAPAAVTSDAAQVFTGNQPPATHTLEIRTRDGATGLPAALVGQPGSWSTVHARCWQGARLQQPAVLAANTDYFLVWRVQGMFHQHSVAATSASNVLSEVRVSDGSTWHAQATLAAKFRLFAPYAAGSTNAYGSARPGVYGDPTIGLSGWPALGSPVDVWLDNAAYGQPALLLIGWPIPGGVSFPFGDVFVTGEVVLLVQPWLHTSPLAGALSHTFFVPNLPAASGLPVSFQFGVFDPAAQLGFAHSAAVTAVLQ